MTKDAKIGLGMIAVGALGIILYIIKGGDPGRPAATAAFIIFGVGFLARDPGLLPGLGVTNSEIRGSRRMFSRVCEWTAIVIFAVVLALELYHAIFGKMFH
ncbi:MAG: hypothetical protein ACLFQX_04880 [Candidatus Kapaibacterium sp.]